MDYLKQFVIPFSGLKVGLHRFEYDIDGKFFEAIECTEFDEGSIKVNLKLERLERMLILDFRFTGSLDVICDRCLESFDYWLDFSKKLIIKFGSERQEISDEIIMIAEADHQINISHFIYEFITLGMPVKKMHPDSADGTSACNPLMLEKLNNPVKADANDPRWDALKKIKPDQ